MTFKQVLQRVDELFHGHEGHVARNVRRLRAAIARNEFRFDELRRSVAGTCPCCVGAALGGTGSEYDLLGDKLGRQHAELERLEAKLSEKKEQP